ncbi:MAG: DUF4276 family protein [Acidobacteria bacterium]|nr:DUF4276 family protein [Acidobacteriota bacterium]
MKGPTRILSEAIGGRGNRSGVKIQPIVEGHGDVLAFPLLLRRLVHEAQVEVVGIGRPIRRPRSSLVKEEGIQRAVRLALVEPECRAVLILLDGDDDCPAELGPAVQAWAAAAANGTPCHVILAHREYEAWFLAAIESLRGRRGVRPDADPHPDPERPRGAKEQLEARMQPGASYLETTDQPAFSALFSLPDAYRRSRSFRKLADSFANLVRAMELDVGVWPPPAWTDGA